MTAGLIWLGAAAVLQLFGSRIRTRWAGVGVVVAAGVVAGATSAPTITDLSIAAAALVVAAVATGHPAENRGLAAFSVSAGLAMVGISSRDLVFSSLTLFSICALISLRWMAIAPGRQTVSGVRALCVGAATLAAIAPLLPVLASDTGPLPVVVIAMTIVGYAPLLGLFPVNGWAASAARTLTSLEIASWFFVVIPLSITVVFRVLAGVPAIFEVNAAHLITFLGLLSGSWSSLRALAFSGRERYLRIFYADIGLAAAALSSGSWQALGAVGILFFSHLLVFFFLTLPAPGRVSWWLISGIPPSPGFWARLLVAQACAVTNVTATVVAVAIAGLITIETLQQIWRGREDETITRATTGQKIIAVAAGFLGLLAAFAPQSVVHAAFGIR